MSVHGRDDVKTSGVPRTFTATAVEGEYIVKPWIVGILRYETVRQQDAPGVRRLVPALALAVRANVRIVADWELFLQKRIESVPAAGDSRARFRVDLVF